MGILEMLGITGNSSTPGADTGSYSDIPFGLRLALASQAAIAMDKGQSPDIGSGLASMAAMRERAIERRKAEAEQKKKEELAGRLADKIEATNPAFAEALRADPGLIDNYMTNQLSMDNWKQQYGVTRKDELADRAEAAKAAAAKEAADREFEMEKIRNQQDFDLGKITIQQKFELDKIAEQRKYEAQKDPMNQQFQFLQNEAQNMPKAPVVQGPPTVAGEAPKSYENIPGTNVQWSGSPEVDFFSKMFKTPLTEEEASRLRIAAATRQNINETFAAIKDDREKIQKTQEFGTPKLEAGYMWADQAAAEKGDFSKGQVPMPGTKAFIEMEQSKKQDEKNKFAEAIRKSAMLGAIDRSIGYIDEAEKGGSLPVAGMGGLYNWAPYTGALSLGSELNTIRGQLGIAELQRMREMSPTGGALGPVSDYENRVLQGTLETLNQSEDPATLKERLIRLKQITMDVIDGSLQEDTGILRDLWAKEDDAGRMNLIKNFDETYGEGASKLAIEAFGQ
jgi:hypothetical protein